MQVDSSRRSTNEALEDLPVPLDACAQALAELHVLTASLDVSGDGTADLLVDRDFVNAGDCLERLGLFDRQPQRERLGLLRLASPPARLRSRPGDGARLEPPLRLMAPTAKGARTPIVLAVALGGALGSAARYGVDRLIERRSFTVFPWSTFTINATGCLLIGVVVATFVYQAAMRDEMLPRKALPK